MTYRPLQITTDAEFLLKLKNYEETRQFAIQTKDEIKLKDHLAWLEKNHQYFHVAELARTRVAVFRIQDTEISIWVDKEHWRNRIATSILMDVRFKGMTAKIVDGNIASMRAFVGAGFIPFDHKDNYYILRRELA